MSQIDMDYENEEEILQGDNIQVPVDYDVEDCVLLAKSYFDLREYQRAAYVVGEVDSSVAIFIKGYSTYLAGEKRKEEEMLEQADPLERSKVVSKELKGLKAELEPLYANKRLDGFGLFLLGLIYKDLDQKAEAIDVLVQSVNVYPWNWSPHKTRTNNHREKDLHLHALTVPFRPHTVLSMEFLGELLNACEWSF